MGKLELNLLGSLDIRLDETPVSKFKSRKSQALLCYLAVTAAQHSRDWLSGMFWGGMPESNARMNLSQALTTLRHYFKPYIITTRNSISINPDSIIQTDTRFLNMVDVEDIESLHQAARSFRGDFLEGFYIRKSPEFEFWVLGERSRCRENILRVLDNLANHYTMLEQPDWISAIKFTNKRLAIEPWQEETQRNLMLFYALNGQRTSALKQFEICREILLADLGVEPGKDTIQLHELIRSVDPATLMEEADALLIDHLPDNVTAPKVGPTRQKESITSNIPFPSTEFIGREQDLQQLNDLFFSQKARLVTITGPGGIGKTRLAIEFADKIITRASHQISLDNHSELQFPDGIFFVSLESIQLGGPLLPAVADAIGFRLDRGKKQLLNHLKTLRLLLILDNFEHLIDNAPSIFEIINSAPGVQVMVTSREKLNMFGEQVFPLQGLTFSTAIHLNSSDLPAGQLFLKSALRQDPNFTLQDSDLEHLTRICQLVEGMPLALELSATWTNTLPLASIAEQIQEDFGFLSTGMVGLPARHRSLRAVIEGSIKHLVPSEQDLFFKLAIFEAGFTLEAAAEVTGASHNDLSKFVDKSLLRYSKNQDRYYIHPILRQYGMEKLSQEKQALDKLNDQHSIYFCEWFATQAQPGSLIENGQKKNLNAMAAEIENTRKGWLWALGNAKFKRLVGKSTSLGVFYIWRGGYLEGERTFRSFRQDLSKDNNHDGKFRMLVVASINNWLGFFSDILGNSSRSLSLLQESRDLLNSPALSGLDVRAEKAHNLMIYSRVDLSLTNQIRTNIIQQARKLYREVDHPVGLPFALTSSARFAILDGKKEEAEQYLVESLDIYRKNGNEIGTTISLTGLGNHAFANNDYRLARMYFEEAIEIAREFNSPEREIVGTLFLGTTHLFSGQFNRAMHHLEKCERFSEERGLDTFQSTAMYFQGYSCLLLGKYDQTIQFAEIALPMAEQTLDLEVVSQLKMLTAAVDLVKGNYRGAYQGFLQVENNKVLSRSGRIIFGEDCGKFGLACSMLGMGNTGEAQQLLLVYLQDAVISKRLDKAMYALSGSAKLFFDLGEIAQSVNLFRFTTSLPFIRNSRWLKDVFVDPIRSQLSSHHKEWNEQYEHEDIWDLADKITIQLRGESAS